LQVDVRIGTDFENDGERELTIAGRLTTDVVHPLDPIDSLLERRCDRAGDRLGRSAGEVGLHRDGRRHDVRILRGRQKAHGCQSEYDNEHIDHRGEPRVINEEVRELHRRCLLDSADNYRIATR
jgi:hypothetical protein